MVRRIYVEKKAAYAAAANELFEDLKGYMDLKGLSKVRILIRYDIEDLDDEVFDTAKKCAFSEPPVDDLYEEDFKPLFFPVESVAMKNRKICYLYNTRVGLIELVNQE